MLGARCYATLKYMAVFKLAVIAPILQMGTLRFRGRNWFAPSCTACKWQSWDQSQVCWMWSLGSFLFFFKLHLRRAEVPGQGLNPSQGSDNARTLTCCATREFQDEIFLKNFHRKGKLSGLPTASYLPCINNAACLFLLTAALKQN